MSELSSETPTILVNGEQEKQQEHQEQYGALAEDTISFVDLEEEDRASGETETQAKMQSVFQQVRNEIRSQAGVRASRSGILELMQRLKDREVVKMTAQVNGECSGESKGPVVAKDVTQEELCEMIEKKLEASQRALRESMEEQITRVREEMQTYTDKALKDMECKMLMQQQPPLGRAQGPDRKQRPSAPSSLASRRGRVLTRTMTTIIPKTSIPVVLGPKTRSETMTFAKGQGSQLMMRDPGLSLQGSKPCQGRKPLLPPANPTLHLRKKAVPLKGKTAK